MTQEQAETLNIIQQVLRCMTISFGALAPDRIGDLSANLAAHARAPGIDPIAGQMLEDLAQGAGMIASARNPKQ